MNPVEVASNEAPPPSSRLESFCVPVWFGIVLATALLMLRQPYAGVRHDAVLYLGQALARIDPSWTRNDFYFQFGSQDRFSVFSRAFVWPIQHLGIGVTEICTLLVCRTSTLVAIWLLARDLAAFERWLAVLSVACLGHYYADARIFSVLEPFVTARTPAEPLALLGLAALLRGRSVLAAAGLFASLACHPLIGLPAAIVAWGFLLAKDRRWAWLATGLLPFAALAFAGVAPFDSLLRRYDEAWFAVVANANADVFITLWTTSDLVTLILDLAVVWIATRGQTIPLARLSRVAVIAVPCLGVVALVGSDLAHDVLITQLQLWRVLWVTNVLAAVWLPSLILAWWKHGPLGRLAAISLATAVFAAAEWAASGWALSVWALITWQMMRRQVALKASIIRLATLAIVLVAALQVAEAGWVQLYQIAMRSHGNALMNAASIPFTWSIVVLPLSGWLLSARTQRRHALWTSVLVAALGLVSLLQFDQRTPIVQFEESVAASGRPFQAQIPPTATVYWEHTELPPVWLLLRRAGFAQGGQFSGVMFNRGTAEVAMDRLLLIRHAVAQDTKCEALQGWMQSGYRFQDCEEDESVLHSICNGKTSHADFFVSQQRYGVAQPISAWRFDPEDGTPAPTYFLYDCRSVQLVDRAQDGAPDSQSTVPKTAS